MIRFVAFAIVLLGLGGCGWFGAKSPDASLGPRSGAQLSSLPPPPIADDQVMVDRVVAIVNQEVITLSELQEAVAFYLRESKQARPQESAEVQALEERVLQRLVEHRVQVQEAKREKVEIVEEELREAVDDAVRRSGLERPAFERELKSQGLGWEAFRRELKDQLLVQRLIRRKVAARVSVTDGEVEDYLRANRATFEALLAYGARHIAVIANPPDTEASWEEARVKIENIRRRLESGEAFADVARKFSEDPSADHGGDLGTLRRGELAPVFENAILALSVGQVSEPVRSPQGFHLFQLEAKEELTGDKLVQARSQARDLLFRQKYQERLDAWLDEVKRRAIITLKAEQKS